MRELSAELAAVANEAATVVAHEDDFEWAPVLALEEAAERVGRSWSQSNLGYQANVYYARFATPPASARFSREWGFLGMFQGTTGDWERHQREDVIAYIESQAGDPDLATAQAKSDEARALVEDLIHRARSSAVKIAQPHDTYLTELLESLNDLALPSVTTIAKALMPPTGGMVAVRDTQAAEEGWQPAAHQVVQAQTLYIRTPWNIARILAQTCERLARHIEGGSSAEEVSMVQLGQKVFLGHGGASVEYYKLGVWLHDHGLEWDVFDRTSTAGMSTKERLLEMLDNAQIAFLFMTPEDETASGTMVARSNVVHEVGLFQGRLGWMKAIILLEDGCEEFSNIEGVGQIRYPKGNVKAAFDEIRGVLEREGVL
jgi:hypothetical protein